MALFSFRFFTLNFKYLLYIFNNKCHSNHIYNHIIVLNNAHKKYRSIEEKKHFWEIYIHTRILLLIGEKLRWTPNYPFKWPPGTWHLKQSGWKTAPVILMTRPVMLSPHRPQVSTWSCSLLLWTLSTLCQKSPMTTTRCIQMCVRCVLINYLILRQKDSKVEWKYPFFGLAFIRCGLDFKVLKNILTYFFITNLNLHVFITQIKKKLKELILHIT